MKVWLIFIAGMMKVLGFLRQHWMKNKTRNSLIYKILSLKRFNVQDSIIIFSEARGGSTWLMEILSEIPKTCINWEPLHVNKGVVPKEYNWGWRPSILKKEKNELYRHLINSTLSFQIFSEWTTSYLRRLKILDIIRSQFVITKFVRANGLIPFIVQNFDFKNKPILLIRHPIDVCISQSKAFDKDKKDPNQIPTSRNPEANAFFQSLKTKLEYNIARWCQSNCQLLDDYATLDKVTVVFYSNLLLNPKEETLKILNTLNCTSKLDLHKIVENIEFKKPSRTDFDKNLKSDSKKQLMKNLENLSKNEKDSIQRIFDHFNFELFDAYQPLPKYTLFSKD